MLVPIWLVDLIAKWLCPTVIFSIGLGGGGEKKCGRRELEPRETPLHPALWTESVLRLDLNPEPLTVVVTSECFNDDTTRCLYTCPWLVGLVGKCIHLEVILHYG